jgi:dTDP-glucose 4,6-dehydratase/UDP-glucuronate decarboxylase
MEKRFRHAVIWEDIRAFVSRPGMNWERLSGQTVLVAGASGFLPGYLADTIAVLNDDEVLRKPARLVALTRTPVNAGDRLGHLLGRPDVKFMVADVTKPYEIPKGVDFLIHGASPASPRDYLARPIATMDANVNGLRTMLDYATHHPVKSLLYISSGAVYGEVPDEHLPVTETFPGNTPLDSQRACYNESKRYAEAMGFAYHRVHGVPIKMVRPFHHYGPGQRLDDGRVLADFMRDGLAGRPIHMLSEGRNLMTLCYAGDAAEAFWRALLSKEEGQAFNISSEGTEYTVRQVAELVAGLFSPPLSVQAEPKAMHPYQKGAFKRSLADISKAQKVLGWQPSTSLQEGLERTLRWHRDGM